MMRWPKKNILTPIGLDVGTRSVKAVQLTAHGKQWQVTAAAHFDLPAKSKSFDAEQATHIVDVLDRRGFQGQRVVLAAPASGLIAELLELPPRGSGAPLDEIARAELSRTSKLEATSFEMSMWDVPTPARSNGSTHAMAVAAPNDKIEAYLDYFTEAGLDVLAMDCQAWALWRACAPLGASGMTGILDIGWSRTLLILVYQGIVVYQRAVPGVSMSLMHKEIAQAIDVDAEVCDYLLRHVALNDKVGRRAEEAAHVRALQNVLARQLELISSDLGVSFGYASHRYPDVPIERLLVVGGAAGSPGLAERLAQLLDMEVKTVAPADLADCPGDTAERCASPALTMALGLAKHEEGLA